MRNNLMDIVNARWRVRLDRHASIWSWFTTNPQGGGFGSSQRSSRAAVWALAVRNIPTGETYEVVINGRLSRHVRGAEYEMQTEVQS